MNTKHAIPTHFGAFGVDATGTDLGPVSLPKIFAAPFRLAFKKGEDITWIEVRSLAGLRNVADMIEKGDLVEIDRFSTIEMQLWGLLAEHSGFLKIRGSTSTLSAGIQPLGEGTGALADDLASIMGGSDDDAINMLGAMQNTLQQKPIDRTPITQPEVTHEFMKADGVNLTSAGEDALRELVLGNRDPALYPPGLDGDDTFAKAVENAIQIFRETPEPTEDDRVQEAQEAIDCAITAEQGGYEGPIVTGPAASRIGRLIADVKRGLDNEADKAVQEEAQAAMDILNSMIDIDEKGMDKVREEAMDLLDRYGVTMEELRDLATAPTQPRVDVNAQSRIEPRVAGKAQHENLKKLLGGISEIDLAMLVDQSEIEPLDPEALAQHQKLTEDLRSKMRGSIDKTDHYKERQVTPASGVPTDQDERAKWLAAGGLTGEFLADGWRRRDAPAPGPTSTSNVDESRPAAGPYDMEEMRRLSGLDKKAEPKSSDEDDSSTT